MKYSLKNISPSNHTKETDETFVLALRHAQHKTYPYNHWLLHDILPHKNVRAITELPFSLPSDMRFDGRRESNNSKRIYFNRENRQRFDICNEVVAAFDSPPVRSVIQDITGAALNESALRIEYCQDTGDFWLEPHTDIKVKKLTLLIYLSDDPALHNCGTDIYDDTPQHTLVYTAPYQMNSGLIFIPAANTWHGFSKRTIHGIRKSLIINYVSKEWRDTWELSY